MSLRKVAADIARTLRAHPERWTRFISNTFVIDGPEAPRCLMGHIRERTGRLITLEMPEFMRAIGDEIPSWVSTSLPDSVKVMLWNDQQESVEAIIAVCEKIANELDPAYVKLRNALEATAALTSDA